MTFNLSPQVSGVPNKQKLLPFTLVPSTATIKAQTEYPVKVIFQPDHSSNHYFDVLLVDIPNQIKPKQVYLRGQCYSRQLFAREYEPFEWRPADKLRRKYEDPLKMLAAVPGAAAKQRIVLEFAREDDLVIQEAET